MVFKFSINGMAFWISETIDGYRWMLPLGIGNLRSTILEAQQDAMNCIQKHIDKEKEAMDIGQYWDNRRYENE